MRRARKAWIALCAWMLLLCHPVCADDQFWLRLYGNMSGWDADLIEASTSQERRVPPEQIESGLEWVEYGASNGAVTINWAPDGEENPVAYVLYESPEDSGRQAAQGTSCQIQTLIPGRRYTLTLCSASNEPLAQWNVEIVLKAMDASGIKIVQVGMMQTDWTNTDFDAIWIDTAPSASAILSDRSSTIPYQFAVEFAVSPLYGEELTYDRLLCVTAPGGETFKSYDTITFEASEYTISWKSGFKQIDPDADGVWLTPGSYTVQMYLNGMLADEKTFEMAP